MRASKGLTSLKPGRDGYLRKAPVNCPPFRQDNQALPRGLEAKWDVKPRNPPSQKASYVNRLPKKVRPNVHQSPKGLLPRPRLLITDKDSESENKTIHKFMYYQFIVI